jgi:hypothetical protein
MARKAAKAVQRVAPRLDVSEEEWCGSGAAAAPAEAAVRTGCFRDALGPWCLLDHSVRCNWLVNLCWET